MARLTRHARAQGSTADWDESGAPPRPAWSAAPATRPVLASSDGSLLVAVTAAGRLLKASAAAMQASGRAGNA